MCNEKSALTMAPPRMNLSSKALRIRRKRFLARQRRMEARRKRSTASCPTPLSTSVPVKPTKSLSPIVGKSCAPKSLSIDIPIGPSTFIPSPKSCCSSSSSSSFTAIEQGEEEDNDSIQFSIDDIDDQFARNAPENVQPSRSRFWW